MMIIEEELADTVFLCVMYCAKEVICIKHNKLTRQVFLLFPISQMKKWGLERLVFQNDSFLNFANVLKETHFQERQIS